MENKMIAEFESREKKEKKDSRKLHTRTLNKHHSDIHFDIICGHNI